MVGFGSEGVDEFGHPIHWGQDTGPTRFTKESVDENNFRHIRGEALARDPKLLVSRVNGLDINVFEDILSKLRELRFHRESDQPKIERLTNEAIKRVEELAKNPSKSQV